MSPMSPNTGVSAGAPSVPPSPLPTLSPFLPARKEKHVMVKSPAHAQRYQKLRRGLSELTLRDVVEEEHQDGEIRTRRRRSLSPKRNDVRGGLSSTSTAPSTVSRDVMLAYKLGPILGQGAFGKVSGVCVVLCCVVRQWTRLPPAGLHARARTSALPATSNSSITHELTNSRTHERTNTRTHERTNSPAQVFLAHHRLTGEQVAIKTYTRAGLRHPEMQKALKSEVAALKVGQSCSRIIRILETCDKQTAGFSIVMEYAEVSELLSATKTKPSELWHQRWQALVT